MYNERVMKMFKNPKNVGVLRGANGIGTIGNAACGDIMRIYLIIEDGIIRDAKFKTFGCAAAIVSSSVATEKIKGMTIEEALKVTNKQILDEVGDLPPQKIHCSVLAQEAIEAAIKDYRKREARLARGKERGISRRSEGSVRSERSASSRSSSETGKSAMTNSASESSAVTKSERKAEKKAEAIAAKSEKKAAKASRSTSGSEKAIGSVKSSQSANNSEKTSKKTSMATSASDAQSNDKRILYGNDYVAVSAKSAASQANKTQDNGSASFTTAENSKVKQSSEFASYSGSADKAVNQSGQGGKSSQVAGVQEGQEAFIIEQDDAGNSIFEFEEIIRTKVVTSSSTQTLTETKEVSEE